MNYKEIKRNIADHYNVDPKYGYKIVDVENFGLSYNGNKIRMLEFERDGNTVFITFRGYDGTIKEFNDRYAIMRYMFPVYIMAPETYNKKILQVWNLIKEFNHKIK